MRQTNGPQLILWERRVPSPADADPGHWRCQQPLLPSFGTVRGRKQVRDPCWNIFEPRAEDERQAHQRNLKIEPLATSQCTDNFYTRNRSSQQRNQYCRCKKGYLAFAFGHKRQITHELNSVT